MSDTRDPTTESGGAPEALPAWSSTGPPRRPSSGGSSAGRCSSPSRGERRSRGGRGVSLLRAGCRRSRRSPTTGPHRHRDGERGRPDRRRVLRRAAQGRPLHAHPEAARAGVRRLRGPGLLRARRHRLEGHAPRRAQHLRAAAADPGRLDDHAADREGAPPQRGGLRVRHAAEPRPQAEGVHPREAARARLHEGGDPLDVPERRLPRHHSWSRPPPRTTTARTSRT